MEFDTRGNLWIGTLDGLNRYNGYDFEIIKPGRNIRGELAGNHIVALGSGMNGNMWIVSREGKLNHYVAARNYFERIDVSPFGQFNMVQASHIYQFDQRWLLLSSFSTVGVYDIENETFHTLQFSGNVRGFIKCMHFEAVLAYGSFGIEMINLRPLMSGAEPSTEKLSAKACYKLLNRNDSLFALIDEGIVLLEKNMDILKVEVDFKQIRNFSVRAASINELVFDGGAYWLGGVNLLANLTPTENGYLFQQYLYDQNDNNTFKGHTVTRLRADWNGNVWIGTAKNGLNLMNRTKNRFRHYSWDFQKLSDPESNPVRAICKTRGNELWLGFDRNGAGVLLPNGEQRFYAHYFTHNGEKRDIQNVRVIFEDSKGNILIGEETNLCFFNRKHNRVETIDGLFPFQWAQRTYSIKEFEKGVLAITSPSQIGFVNLTNGYLSTLAAHQVQGTIRDVVMDNYQNLWIAKNDNGLMKIEYPGGNTIHITSGENSFSDNKTYCLLPMGDSLWVGTNSGLNLIDVKTNQLKAVYYEEDGLCNNIVYSLYSDKEGNLWMSTNKGISKMMAGEQTFKTYLPNDFFMDDAHFMDENGTIYYGGYTGVVSFSPSDIVDPSLSAKPYFEGFYLFHQQIFPGDTIDNSLIFHQSVWDTQTIKLHHQQNSFSMAFNAYPYEIPNNHRFRYRLKGLHENWYDAPPNRLATYNKVAPGEYVFELQVASSLSAFEGLSTIEIEIVPPFWQKTWFRIMFVIALLTLLFAGFLARIRSIKKRNEWLNQKVEEQTSELREQNRTIIKMSEELKEANESKLRFFTNISHEFRTPLTIILGHIENMGQQPKHVITAVRNNAMRLLRLIDQVIDLRKLDQDLMKVNAINFDLVGFVSDILGSMQVIAAQKNIRVEFMTQLPMLNVCLDADKMEKIVYNLFSNAVKFSPVNHAITIGIDDEGEKVSLRFIDEGIGISADELKHIFDRFYRTNSGQHTSFGYGIGLSMVKGLVELQQGHIEVESTVGKGTTFKVTLPKTIGSTGAAVSEPVPLIADMVETNISPALGFMQKLSGKKLLIVEDHPELLAFLREKLSVHYNVSIAQNGQEALVLIDKTIPDLIISDITMPLMDGMTLCQRVKSSDETSHIPFILLTAKTDNKSKVEGFEAGVDDYIEKPFHIQVLMARIQALLLNREKLKEQFVNGAKRIPVLENIAGKERDFLNKVETIIGRNIHDHNFSIECLCSELNMSRASFYRKFTDMAGSSPADYIRKVRLRQAYQQLVSTGLSVSEISEKAGFMNVSNFRKCFRNEFGKTPTEVQKGN